MSKARTLADFISDGSEFADGTISVAEVSGAAPLASPTFTGSVTVPNLTTTGNVTFGDNDKALFGADGDLEIYHDGGNSRIWDKGNGNLIISASNFQVNDGTNGEIFIRAIDDSSVELRHSNNIKFVTTTSGVDITGEVKADKFTNDEALPDIRPSLLLDFANSKTLDPRITFTRGSTATYWDGKTTTKAEENLILQSQTLDVSPWSASGGSVSANSTTAPDGTTTAYKLIESTGTSHAWFSGVAVTGQNRTVVGSLYAKAAERSHLTVNFSNVTLSGNVWTFDLSAQTATLDNSGAGWSNVGANITSVGNGWYRLQIYGTLTSSASSVRFDVRVNNGSGYSYTGDGSSGVHLWGFQLETERTVATAYTPTTSSPIVKYQPVLQTAASGEARFDHDPVTGESKGLLIEEARTNLIAYSDFTNSSGYNNIFKVGSSTAPDGTNTATILRASADNQYCYTFVGGLTLTQNTTYTYSVFVKAANSFAPNYIWLLGNTSTDTFNFIDPSNGTVGTSASGVTTRVEDVGNGWYRCAITFTNTQATGAQQIGVGFAQTNGSPQTSSDETQIEVWGEQIEVGFGASSYIPTSGSTVTRSADDASIALTNEVSLQEATVYAEAATYRAYANETAWCPVWQFNDGVSTANGRFDVRAFQATYGSQAVLTGVGGSTTLLNDGQTVTNGEFYKYGLFWNQGSVSFYKNGAGVGATTNQYVSDTWDTLDIGWGDRGGRKLDGHIKKLSVYPQALSHNTMLAMTEA